MGIKKRKAAGILTMLGGVLAVVLPVIFMYNFNTLMSEAKGTGILIGPYVTLIVGIFTLVAGF